jgi:hypothetical protein
MTTVFDLAVGGILAELMIYTNERYFNEIFQAARQYWKDGSKGGFKTRMNGTIKFGLQAAFEQGASVVGVEPDEFESEDRDFINAIIEEEKSHVPDLLSFIDGLANDPTARLSDADYRLNMWANRYPDVQDQAKVYFGKRTRLQWTLGDAEHCETCLALSNIVAWAQEWQVAGIQPKSRDLACKGYNCACSLDITSKRRSPNALSRILDAMTSGHV